MIVPVLIASALLARSVYGAAYIGCLDSSTVTGGSAVTVGSGYSLSDCLAECSSQSYSHGFYDASISECYCDNSEGAAANYQEATDSSGACAVGQASAWYLGTGFGFNACSTVTTSSGDTYTYFVSNAQGCFESCAENGAAQFTRSGSAYICICGASFALGPATNCPAAQTSRGLYVYSQTVDTEPSADLSRRRLKERLRLARALNHQYCPVGLTACLVGDDKEAFECIDTKSDLESCGGCTIGLYGATLNGTATGQNCENLKGVAMGAVTCNRGQCEVSACKYGYVLVDNECVRMQ
ncbi:hypothetical protein I316_07625 [Kwoniella heveanensis BCC8398]|uniref:Protein CPL1-like domain-containing protein n=1 Tax=Kwoniella heveanensis BCC8398 TaxID=1296120 RepID=A0A1B9GIA4_9TREE|nr:hypothetical protein I316_07625 [Kwoniella heveanensis BCC8398]